MGTLKSGERIAIKVIRSNFKESFLMDISKIERSVKIIGRDGKLYFLDCAGLSTISIKLRKGLFWFFYYLSRYDYSMAAENLHKMSQNTLDQRSYSVFLEKFIALYSDFTHATVSQVSLTRRMMETIKLGINSGMDFGSGMFPVIKSLMYLDGMVMRCNPQAVLMDDVRGFTDILLEKLSKNNSIKI